MLFPAFCSPPPLLNLPSYFPFLPCPPPSAPQYKLCRVRHQKIGDRGVPYIATNDGRTIRYPDPLIKVNDTVKIELETGKVVEHIKFDVGNICMVTGEPSVLAASLAVWLLSCHAVDDASDSDSFSTVDVSLDVMHSCGSMFPLQRKLELPWRSHCCHRKLIWPLSLSSVEPSCPACPDLTSLSPPSPYHPPPSPQVVATEVAWA